MNDEQTEEKAKTPPPPEKEFLQKLTPDEERSFRGPDFFEKKWVRWLLVLIVPLLLCVLLFPHGKAKTKPKASGHSDEKRTLMTRETMERAIQVAGVDRPKPSVETRQVKTQVKKRNYASDMAVFIFREEEEKARQDVLLASPEDEIGLPSGTRIPVYLLNRIFSFNTAAPVLAVLPQDFKWRNEIRLPKGSRFLGEANVMKSLDRINVRFDLLILPDGREMRIRAMGLSADGSAGIRGKVEKHGDLRVLKAIGETLLAGAGLFVGNTAGDPYSLDDQMRMNLAQNLTNEARRDLRGVKVETSITTEAYTPIQIILLEAI